MGVFMKAMMVGLAAVLAATIAVPALAKARMTPAQEWEAWRKEENAAWATTKYALLKIDDAVYLKPNETATLAPEGTQLPHYKFKLTREAPPTAFSVEYRGPDAIVRHNGKSTTYKLSEKTLRIPVKPGIEFGMQLAQLTPGKMGLRAFVYNQENPDAKNFQGLEHFPFDPKFVIEAKFEPADKIEGVDFQTSRGWYKRFYRAGFAVFDHEGKHVRLPLYSDSDDPKKIKDLSAFFLDELTGKETYGVGRYIDIKLTSFPAITVTIDFNRAYNPNCARSPHYNCPVATDLVPLAVRAGEKKPSEH
jgi:uncharacterized protein (DUF1684 family)